MEGSTLSIADLELEESLGTSPGFLYDVLARRGRCRLIQCYSSSHENLVGFDLAIFEFVRKENLALFVEDELVRLKLLGDLKEPIELTGDRCLLSVKAESETSAVLYYVILYEHFVFRMTFGFARLEKDQDPIRMSHSIVKDSLAIHANIGLRT